MATLDGLDALSIPQLALPEDIGDGPFWTAMPDPNLDKAARAETETLFRREEPFEETWLTDMPVFGKSDFISMGRLYISDVIPPMSFRRVHQHFTNEQSIRLSGTPVIAFQGGSIAIIEEGINALAPEADGTIGTALDALEVVGSLVRPTQSARLSSYTIRLRMPGYEPIGSHTTIPPLDVMCLDPRTPSARRLAAANTVEKFDFRNSAGDQKVFKIDYPVGRSIPLILDIVNEKKRDSVVVDFTVAVLIDRRAANAQENQ